MPASWLWAIAAGLAIEVLVTGSPRMGIGGLPSPLTQLQDRPPNFRSEDGRLFLVRCFACDIDHGVENWAMAVASGQCAWCGWQEDRSPPTGDGCAQ